MSPGHEREGQRRAIRLVSFASGPFVAPQRVLASSALAHGVDAVSSWTREDLVATPFYRDHRALLDHPRGAGYWAWKPYVILEELRALAPGDVLIYCDAGRPDAPHRIDSPLDVLVDWVVRERDGILPGVYIPEWGPNRRWTKGECFRVMDCEGPRFGEHPQIQATFSVWQRHERSIAFVSEWLAWCTKPAAIADERAFPEIADAADFVDHRHDQSVLTLLALKHGLRCFGDPDAATPCGKNPSSLVDRIMGRTWRLRRRAFDDAWRTRATVYGRGPRSQARRIGQFVSTAARVMRIDASS